MKIALLDAHNQDYEKIWKISKEFKDQYCKIMNYDCLSFEFEKLPNNFFPTWGRIFALQQHLPNYDWILYLDTDVIITNYSVELSQFLNTSKNIILSRMPNREGAETHLSTSAMLIRNCEWTFNFLDKWLLQTHFNTNPYFASKENILKATMDYGGLFYEQSAMHYLFDTDEDAFNNIEVMPNCWFNTRDYNKNTKDFLVHFASQNDKYGRMKSFLKRKKLFL